MTKEVDTTTRNLHVDTSDLVPVDRPIVHLPPPVDMTPLKSPFYRGQVPTTAIVNPDAVRNFDTHGIPQYRIVPPQPLNLAGSSTNATPAAATVQTIIPKPPAPSISEALTTTPVGFEFAFNQVNMPSSIPPGAVISTYKVYRSSTNDTGSAKTTQTVPHNPANVGDPVRVQDAQPAGTTMFYWVSAVNVSGEESALTPAQSGSVVSGSRLGTNGKLATADDVEADGATYGRINVTALSTGNVDIAKTGVVNKILDNIADGTTYARPLSTRISAGKPLIDFSEGIHLNKLISNIPGVVSDTLVKNGDFEAGSSGWQQLSGNALGVSYLTAQSGLPRGSSFLQLSSRSDGNLLITSTDYIPVDPAKTYLFECWMKIPVALTNGASFRPLLAEYDNTKTALPAHVTAGASYFYQTIITSTTGNTWQYFAFECTGSAASPGTGQFNSSAKYVQAGVMLVASATTGQLGQIMGIRFSEVAAGHRRAISTIDSSNIVITSGLDFARGYTNKHLDNIPDGTNYIRFPNAPTNRNLIPDSGFKTFGAGLYWTPAGWVVLNGKGSDGGNAIGFLGTGTPSGFPEAALKQNAILLSAGSYTISAHMDATHLTTSQLDMGVYLSINPGLSSLDGGVAHATQTFGNSGRTFTNFTLSLGTWTANHAYNINDLILDSNGSVQAVVTAGTSGASAPTWATTLTNATTDNTVTWELINKNSSLIPVNVLIFPSNATITSGQYAIVSNPQLEVQPPSATPTPYKENPGDDTSGSLLVDLANTRHGPMSVSTPLKLQGSIIPGQSFPISYNASANVISFSWTATSLLFADGSTVNLTSGSQVYSGLSPSTQYWFYPYLDVATGTIAFANGNPPPTLASSTFAIQAALDGRIPIPIFPISTPVSGGISGSDGTGTCPDSQELVAIRRLNDSGEVIFDGEIKAGDVVFGDYIKGFCFETKQDVYRRVIGTGMNSCAAWRIIKGHKVSPCEPVYLNGQWAHAYRIPGASFDTVVGIKMDLFVEADEFDQHNYWLVGPAPLLIHNPLLPRS